MTMQELKDVLTPQKIAEALAAALNEPLRVVEPRPVTADATKTVRRVCIHLNDDETAAITLHARHYRVDEHA